MASASSLDPLRYGLRALEEMAREQASVAPPPRVTAEVFAPRTALRGPSREGAALSLRLFSDAPDDATDFVLGDASSLRLSPIPPRGASLFEAHAALRGTDVDDTLTLGFPLVTFVQQGSARAAPLFSLGGARARWTLGEAKWELPEAAREGGPVTLPDALALEVADEAQYALHGGVWHFLFGLDGGALSKIGAAARSGLGALVRAATEALDAGGEADEEETPTSTSPLTREELEAFCEAAARRAPASRVLRCFPHGLVMLPPRGDPTSGLRSDLRALLEGPAPARGPLAVYLGTTAGPPRDAPVWSTGGVPPTTSQLAAARALEGTEDLVAVCGPPGCGKTALLHLVTAQTVVQCALAGLWDKAPARIVPWSLVVTSTNNAAVDHALAPFVATPDIPLALRLGNRRTLAETTTAALAAAMTALEQPERMSLAEARAAFEAKAASVRARLQEEAAHRKARAAETTRRAELARRAETLRTLVARARGRVLPDIALAVLDEAAEALSEHAEAASRLPSIHLEGKGASVERACEKWARANEVRGPRIEPALRALGLPAPFAALDPSRAREHAAEQHLAIESLAKELAAVRELLATPDAENELASIEAELARTPDALRPFEPDPALYEAALALRDAWARTHRAVLSKRLETAYTAASDDRAGARGKPLPHALHELAPLFPVAGCTLLSMRASFPLASDVIDRLVVDEAAQCAPVYAIPALARARRAMTTGDVAQLPPVYTLDPRVDERIAKGLDEKRIGPFRMSAEATSSAQAVAEPRARARVSLVEHFRSQPPIVALASRWSGYRLDVRTPERSLADVSPRLGSAVITIAVEGVGARAAEGVVNEAEAELAVAWVESLLADGVSPTDIAVLTPFVGQCARIERALGGRGLLERGGVLVSTVHRLQGGERRVVIFSVTATERRHLRWLGERPHLLHVATSRARDHLVTLVEPRAAAREAALAPFAEALART